jgi:hypothetical protein
MAATAAFMLLPGLVDAFKPSAPPTQGDSSEIPDYQATLSAVQRQQAIDQGQLNALGQVFKGQSQQLQTKIDNQQKTFTSQLSAQQEVFQKNTVAVSEVVKNPGLDPQILQYGLLGFGALALFIVLS